MLSQFWSFYLQWCTQTHVCFPFLTQVFSLRRKIIRRKLLPTHNVAHSNEGKNIETSITFYAPETQCSTIRYETKHTFQIVKHVIFQIQWVKTSWRTLAFFFHFISFNSMKDNKIRRTSIKSLGTKVKTSKKISPIYRIHAKAIHLR